MKLQTVVNIKEYKDWMSILVFRCFEIITKVNHIIWIELTWLDGGGVGFEEMRIGWMDGRKKESREGRGRKAVLVYLDRLWVVAPSVKYTRLTPTLSSPLHREKRSRAAGGGYTVNNKLSSAKAGKDGRLTREGGKWEGVIV